MSGPFSEEEALNQKKAAKNTGTGQIEASVNNKVVTVVNEGYHGAVRWKGSNPTPDGPIVVAGSTYADGTLAPCDPPVGSVLEVGQTINAPAFAFRHGLATVSLIRADGSLVTISSGQSATAVAKVVSFNITADDVEDEPSSATLINLDINGMVVDIKRLNKKSNLNINSPALQLGIRG